MKRPYCEEAAALVDEAVRAFAWPGGYPLFAVMADGGTLCPACCESERASILDAERDRQWRIVGVGVHWEGDPIACDHCGAEVESAYGPCEEEAK